MKTYLIIQVLVLLEFQYGTALPKLQKIPKAPRIPDLDVSSLPEFVRKYLPTEPPNARHAPKDTSKKEKAAPKTYGIKLINDQGIVWNDLGSPKVSYHIGNDENNTLKDQKDIDDIVAMINKIEKKTTTASTTKYTEDTIINVATTKSDKNNTCTEAATDKYSEVSIDNAKTNNDLKEHLTTTESTTTSETPDEGINEKNLLKKIDKILDGIIKNTDYYFKTNNTEDGTKYKPSENGDKNIYENEDDKSDAGKNTTNNTRTKIPEAPRIPDLDYSSLPEFVRKYLPTEPPNARHAPKDTSKKEKGAPKTYGIKLINDQGIVWNDLVSPKVLYHVGNNENNALEEQKDIDDIVAMINKIEKKTTTASNTEYTEDTTVNVTTTSVENETNTELDTDKYSEITTDNAITNNDLEEHPTTTESTKTTETPDEEVSEKNLLNKIGNILDGFIKNVGNYFKTTHDNTEDGTKYTSSEANDKDVNENEADKSDTEKYSPKITRKNNKIQKKTTTASTTENAEGTTITITTRKSEENETNTELDTDKYSEITTDNAITNNDLEEHPTTTQSTKTTETSDGGVSEKNLLQKIGNILDGFTKNMGKYFNTTHTNTEDGTKNKSSEISDENVNENEDDKFDTEKDLAKVTSTEKPTRIRQLHPPSILEQIVQNDQLWQWLNNMIVKYLEILIARIQKSMQENVQVLVQEYLETHECGCETNSSRNDIRKINKYKPDLSKDTQNDTSVDTLSDIESNVDKESTEVIDEGKLTRSDKMKDNIFKRYKNKQPKQNNNGIEVELEKSYVNSTIFGNCVGNEKVTNVFIFNMNADDKVLLTSHNSSGSYTLDFQKQIIKNDKHQTNNDTENVTTESTIEKGKDTKGVEGTTEIMTIVIYEDVSSNESSTEEEPATVTVSSGEKSKPKHKIDDTEGKESADTTTELENVTESDHGDSDKTDEIED